MNKTVICLLFFIGCFFTSCVPTKDLIYLQDKDGGGNGQAINAVASKPYRLQTNDIINITIKAIDQKIVEMFDADESASTNQTEESLYFNGYTIDDHGNVRIPVLGEVNVLGLT